MELPLVTVICLCYNHEDFIEESIASVLNQTYRNLEIIIVDDASEDRSRERIQNFIAKHPNITFLPLLENHGNCKAFNKGLSLAKGEFIVDFSTDDVMVANRIEKQISLFSGLPPSYGVVFTDVVYIDESGNKLYKHFEYLFRHKLLSSIPQGDVYAAILKKFFVSSPSMIVKREVFQYLEGYDENLSYEDFDFWVRSSRKYKYALINEVLTKVRKRKSSLSTRAYRRGRSHLHSTYLVCRKALSLNKSVEEDESLIARLRYEYRHSILTGNFEEAKLFFDFLKEMKAVKWYDYLFTFIGKIRLPMNYAREGYHLLRYGRSKK